MNIIQHNKKIVYATSFLFATILLFGAKSIYATENSCVDIKQNLRAGMADTGQNKDIFALQNFLYTYNYLKVKPTGYFGRLTEMAVKDFQYKEKIYSSGFVGAITRSKISSISCFTKNETIIQNQATTTPSATNTNNGLGLPYKSTNFYDWGSVWGNFSTSSSNLLTLKAEQTTTGAGAFLPNTVSWKNYKFSTNVYIGQASFSLISRYVDENNFIGCTFSGKYIEIIQKLNGKTEVVAFTIMQDYPYSNFFNTDINLSMRVDGKSVGCSLLGSSDNIAFNNIDDKLSTGGIGVQIWNNAVGIANAKIKSVLVEQI